MFRLEGHISYLFPVHKSLSERDLAVCQMPSVTCEDTEKKIDFHLLWVDKIVYKLDPFLGSYKTEDEPCASDDIPVYKFSSATMQA
jgi:hypothetical protein